ncbi:MAG: hypothetical protein OIF32_10890, partial [Campylobacterales bacterium]|nr:hypothetical protein [Campylobacterales bacterium]
MEFTALLLYFFLSSLITLLVFSYESLKRDGWENAYIFLNKSFLNFIKWGKNKDFVVLSETLLNLFYKVLFVSFLLFIVVSSINILNFLFTPIILIVGFSIYAISSYKWVFKHKQELKKFLNSVRMPLLPIILFIFFMILIPYMQEDFINCHLECLEGKLIKLIVFSLILGLFFLFGAYAVMWGIFGLIPTVIIIFFFFLTKSSIVIEKIMGIKRFR